MIITASVLALVPFLVTVGMCAAVVVKIAWKKQNHESPGKWWVNPKNKLLW